MPLGLIDSLNPKLWIVTATAQGRRSGLIATFVTPVSIVPDVSRFLITIANQHATHDLIVRSKAFGLHLLRADQAQLAYRFGSVSGRTADKFSGLRWEPGKLGCPVLHNCLAAMECRVELQTDIGDRTLFVGQVISSRRNLGDAALAADEFFGSLTDEQREILDNLYARDIPIDREKILDWQNRRRPV